ncbi:MAG: DUF3575 domain-containing protein [Myxococcales bacterium]|nr:DUF3575 domain-containing protein [Myxococcales bacterium]
MCLTAVFLPVLLLAPKATVPPTVPPVSSDVEAENEPFLAISVSVPRAFFKVAELQLELMFADDFSVVFQGGYGVITVDRAETSDLDIGLWDVGFQARGYFYGTAPGGGAFAGLAAQYARGAKSEMALLLHGVGAGLVLGYKWAFEAGPFIDLNLGAGYGYVRAESTAGPVDQKGKGTSVFPFANLNVGWAL